MLRPWVQVSFNAGFVACSPPVNLLFLALSWHWTYWDLYFSAPDPLQCAGLRKIPSRDLLVFVFDPMGSQGGGSRLDTTINWTVIFSVSHLQGVMGDFTCCDLQASVLVLILRAAQGGGNHLLHFGGLGRTV
jgi:hypothetical protein